MAISNLPTPPSRSDQPATFISKADAFISALPTFVTEANAQAAALTLNSTTDTSSSSVPIGTGAKTFTVSSGKSFQPGMYLVIADTAAPSTNSMYGQVTSYSGTSLVMNILSVLGSGTKTAWTISQSAAGGASLGGNIFTGLQKFATGANIASAATLNLATATGNTVHVTGTTTITAVTMTSGQQMEVIFDGACQLTYHATNQKLNTGGVNYTTSAGDSVFYFYDGTTVYAFIGTASGASPLGFATNAEYAAGTDTTKPLNSAVARARNIVAGTAVATTSGTSIDFTGIPTWAKRVTIMFNGVSTNGTSLLLVQIGSSSGGIENTGYLGSAGVISNGGASVSSTFTTGFGIYNVGAAAAVIQGKIEICLQNSLSWVSSNVISRSDSASGFVAFGSGSKTLSSTLDRVRLTTVNGTDTFDAGSVNIFYE